MISTQKQTKENDENLVLTSEFWSNINHTITCKPKFNCHLETNTTIFICHDSIPIQIHLITSTYTALIKPGVTHFQFNRIVPSNTTTQIEYGDFLGYLTSFPVRFKPYKKHSWHTFSNKHTIHNNIHFIHKVIFPAISYNQIPSLSLLARKACINQNNINTYSHNIPVCSKYKVHLIDGDTHAKQIYIQFNQNMEKSNQIYWPSGITW